MTQRVRYLLGGIVAACGLVPGLVLIATTTAAALSTSPELRDGFNGDQVVTVEFDPADPAAIYVADGGDARAECTVRSPTGEPVPIAAPPRRYRETVGDDEWIMLNVVEAPAAGAYQVTCTGSTTVYAIGDASRADQAAGYLLRTIVALGLLAIGAGVGGGLILVTYLRRSR